MVGVHFEVLKGSHIAISVDVAVLMRAAVLMARVFGARRRFDS